MTAGSPGSGPESVADQVFATVPQNFEEFTCTVEEGDTVVITARFKGKNKSGAGRALRFCAGAIPAHYRREGVSRH